MNCVANEFFRRPTGLNPLNKIAYYDIGVIYNGSGQRSPVEIAFQKSLLIAPHYFPAFYDLAGVYANKGDTRDAMTVFELATKVSWNSKVQRARAHFNLGYLYDASSDRPKGDAAFTTAVRLDRKLAKRIPNNFVPRCCESNHKEVKHVYRSRNW